MHVLACVCIKVLIGQWLSFEKIDTVTRLQILNETFCRSLCASNLGKDKNLTILLPGYIGWCHG